MPGELMPDRKFVVATFGADHDDAPYGLGLAHYLYWLVWLKRNVTRFWAFYLDKFSSPTAVGKYPSGTDKPDQQKLLDALRAIQRDSAVVVPQGMEVTLLEALKSSAADHKGFVDQMNEAILMVCLGQTATAQGTAGKLGGDAEREAVKDAILKADSDLLSERFNRTIVTWLTEWNFPGAVPPTVYRVFSDEDLNARIDRDVKISGMGFKPTLKYIQETYGGDWQESATPAPDGSANLTQSGDGGKKTAFAENDETNIDPTSSDSQTDILADQSADAGKVILDKVRDLVDNAESLEQLRDDLLAAYGDLDSSQLVNVMELAFIAADLSGRYDVQEEK
jgi:phage gp29-like protein